MLAVTSELALFVLAFEEKAVLAALLLVLFLDRAAQLFGGCFLRLHLRELVSEEARDDKGWNRRADKILVPFQKLFDRYNLRSILNLGHGLLPRQRVGDFDHHLHTMATSSILQNFPHTTGNRRSPGIQRKAAAFEPMARAG